MRGASVRGASERGAIAIVPFRDDHAAAFRSLNLEWIEHWFAIEPEDRRLLDGCSAVVESDLCLALVGSDQEHDASFTAH